MKLKIALRWIAVEDRLPKDNELVVATSGIPKLTHVCRRINFFGKYIWRINDSPAFFEDENVKYWIPLETFDFPNEMDYAKRIENGMILE